MSRAMLLQVGLSLLLSAAASSSSATVVPLNFLGNGGTFDFGTDSGLYVDGTGVQLTFQALINGVVQSGSVLNASGSAFGINKVGTDTTDELDVTGGIESIQITFTAPFNTNVNLNSISINNFGGSDAGTLTVAGGSPVVLTSGAVLDPSNTLMNGQSLIVAASAGSFGFSGLSFTTTTIQAPSLLIPEPNSIFLLGCLAIVPLHLRRKRVA